MLFRSVRRHVALIRSVSRHLKKFAHQRGAAIVVTNQAQTSSKIDGFAIVRYFTYRNPPF